MRLQLVMMVLVSSCAFPGDEVGVLSVENASIVGSLAGAEVDTNSPTASGYCTDAGWSLRLRASDVRLEIDVRDLFWSTPNVVVTFRNAQGRESMTVDSEISSDGLELASARVRARVDSEWVDAERALFIVLTGSDDMIVNYEIDFPDGESVRGAFHAQMPTSD